MNKHIKPLEFLSVAEAAAYLKITRQMFTRRQPPPPDARIGRYEGWTKETLDEWDKGLKKKPGPASTKEIQK